MVRGLFLSWRDANALGMTISQETGLETKVYEYETNNRWFYIIVYDNEGHSVDTIDTEEEARELIRTYRKDR